MRAMMGLKLSAMVKLARSVVSSHPTKYFEGYVVEIVSALAARFKD